MRPSDETTVADFQRLRDHARDADLRLDNATFVQLLISERLGRLADRVGDLWEVADDIRCRMKD